MPSVCTGLKRHRSCYCMTTKGTGLISATQRTRHLYASTDVRTPVFRKGILKWSTKLSMRRNARSSERPPWFFQLRNRRVQQWRSMQAETPCLETSHGAMKHLPVHPWSGIIVLRAADQTACRFSAADLPVLRSATTSKAIFCPSLRARMPARSTALMCTKTSLPPSSGWIKPKPLSSLKNFTVPCVI